MKRRLLFATLALLGASLASAQSDPGYSLFGFSYVGVGNFAVNGDVTFVPGDNANDGVGNSHWNATATYGGDNASGNPATETFTAATHGSADYGSLHAYAMGSVEDLFYNANNPIYYNSNTGQTNPNGTPDLFYARAYAGFTDTLQFGGQLQSGYQARYVFHLDGTLSGAAENAYIETSVPGDPSDYEFANQGANDMTVGTAGFAVNGQTPQKVSIELDSYISISASYQTAVYGDGSNVGGLSDFNDTATLLGIELVDANGNVVPTSQWNVTSASGTRYAQIGPAPEPTSLLALAVGALGVLRRRKRA